MGIKHIIHAGSRSAHVLHDAEWDEYCVQFFSEGVRVQEQDYFTNDEQDAVATARWQLASSTLHEENSVDFA